MTELELTRQDERSRGRSAECAWREWMYYQHGSESCRLSELWGNSDLEDLVRTSSPADHSALDRYRSTAGCVSSRC